MTKIERAKVILISLLLTITVFVTSIASVETSYEMGFVKVEKKWIENANKILQQNNWGHQKEWMARKIDSTTFFEYSAQSFSEVSKKVGLSGVKKLYGQNLVSLVSKKPIEDAKLELSYFIEYTLILDKDSAKVLGGFIDVVPSSREEISKIDSYSAINFGRIYVTEKVPLNTNIKQVLGAIKNYDIYWKAKPANLNFSKGFPQGVKISGASTKIMQEIFLKTSFNPENVHFYESTKPMYTFSKGAFFTHDQEQKIIEMSIDQGYQNALKPDLNAMQCSFYFGEKLYTRKSDGTIFSVLLCAQIAFPSSAYIIGAPLSFEHEPIQKQTQTAFIIVSFLSKKTNSVEKMLYPINASLNDIVKDIP